VAKVSDAHLEARRQSIIDAACDVFSSKGLEQATMAEIAARAGLSPGAIYRYFANKEDLANGCMTESAGSVMEQWMLQPAATGDAMGDFAELSRLTFALLNDARERVDTALMLERVLKASREGESELLGEFGAEWRKVRAGVTARLTLAQETGQMPVDMDMDRIAGALFAFYWGSRLGKLLMPDWDSDEQLVEVQELLGRVSLSAPQAS